MKTRLFLLFLCSFASLSARETKQEIHILGLGSSMEPPVIHLKTTSTKFTEVELGGTRAAPPVKVVNSDGAIQIFGPPEENDRGKKVHAPLGVIKSDPSWKEAFAVVSSVEKDGETTISGRAFSLSKKDLPEGAIMLANLSAFLIKGQIGSEVVTLNPQESRTFRFKDPAGENVAVIFQYQKEGETDWKRMVSTRWPVPKDGRRVMLMYPNTKGGLQTKTIPIRNDSR